ncbi:MAG TPA: serine hydrolase domain-containing protein [Longimicrobiales bacterium]|nr:serine hydrolase domain-containing protein [Longimicrobiales bacterium]
MRRPLLLPLFVLVAAPVAAQRPDDARIVAAVDSIVDAALREDLTPGMGIAVVRGGDTLVMKGYGLADVEHDVPVTDETVFRIGSLTKQFTSAAVMKLVEEGRIQLDATIDEYLPEYDGPGRDVTIHQLLNHTSGIPSYTGLGEEFWEKSRLDLTHEQMLEMFEDDPLEFVPGAGWSYNNSGYYLLGMVIEAVTDESYEDHLTRTQWQPLGLEQTSYCRHTEIIPHRAEGYAVDVGVLVNAPPLSMNPPGAAGALCSTPRDLVHWNDALVSGDVVSAESYRRMTTATRLSNDSTVEYGYGLAPGELEGHRMVGHSGGINGFSAYLSYYPDEDLTIAVLANGPTSTGRVQSDIARAVLGLPAREPPRVEEQPLPAEQRAQYVGSYDLAPALPLQVTIYEQGERLMAQATGQGTMPLYYQGGHRFAGPPGSGIELEFAVTDGVATGFTLHQGGGEFAARRMP